MSLQNKPFSLFQVLLKNMSSRSSVSPCIDIISPVSKAQEADINENHEKSLITNHEAMLKYYQYPLMYNNYDLHKLNNKPMKINHNNHKIGRSVSPMYHKSRSRSRSRSPPDISRHSRSPEGTQTVPRSPEIKRSRLHTSSPRPRSPEVNTRCSRSPEFKHRNSPELAIRSQSPPDISRNSKSPELTRRCKSPDKFLVNRFDLTSPVGNHRKSPNGLDSKTINKLNYTSFSISNILGKESRKNHSHATNQTAEMHFQNSAALAAATLASMHPHTPSDTSMLSR